jgi:hypothetical protein
MPTTLKIILMNTLEQNNVGFHTLSGRLLALAMSPIGKADVFDANMQ